MQAIQEIGMDIRVGAQIIGRWSLDLLLPPQCLLTGQRVSRHGDLSPLAWQELNFIDKPFCPSCGLPYQVELDEALACGACAAEEGFEEALISTNGLDKIRAALRYDDFSGRLVLGLKYADRLDSAAALARLLRRAGHELLAQPEAVIVPVPLHASRMRSRRFNQSALLARHLAEQSGHEVFLDLIERTRATPQQQGLSAKARERNVQGAFRVREKYQQQLAQRPIILVDDVLTTGSTLKACARLLKRAGAKQVSGLVLTRVVPEGVGAI